MAEFYYTEFSLINSFFYNIYMVSRSADYVFMSIYLGTNNINRTILRKTYFL